MSGNTWVSADHHFGHQNIVKFTKEDGTKLRPWDDFEQHDADIIRFHNELVDPQDRVYLLGDVCINRKHLWKLSQMNGRKVLVKGNYDILKLREYAEYVDDIRAYVVGKMGGEDDRRYILSHIPVHPDSLIRFGINIHGHTHSGSIQKAVSMAVNRPWSEPDNRYKCVSLEHTNFRPVKLQTLIK